jgi:hypothetical protein
VRFLSVSASHFTDAHGVHEVVHRDAFEHLDVFKDVFRHLRPVLCGYGNARRKGESHGGDGIFHGDPQYKPFGTN